MIQRQLRVIACCRRRQAFITLRGTSNTNTRIASNIPKPRTYATTARTAIEDFYRPKRRTFGPWFIGFMGVGAAMAAYGGYVLYETLTMWPPEVRSDLRNALTAKFKGDLDLSERYFHRAWLTIQTLPISSLGSLPYLKLTGVAVSLADVLEIANKPEQAYEICVQALDILQSEDVKDQLGGQERLRGVAIAAKLGELAEELHKPAEEEEKWKVWAVEEVLRVVKAESGNEGQAGQINLPMMALPKWITKADVGAPLEALGAFYGRTGRLDYAMPLYLQAISLLIPPAPKKASVEDRCRGAQLMGSLSELLMRGPPSPERLHQAEAWASQALAVITKARGEAGGTKIDTCEMAYAMALFNVAAFKEMANDKSTARNLYKEGLAQSRAVGMQEGIVEASEALKRLDSENTTPKDKS
ncbi:hypothetical protein VNI00_007672 [Paramarasmius palmivorus]|uniref:Uncharacterized protein n=1 Tax=Paramarasmius palmivorus TaxID=297713 RepID=A0AAW0D243_9AGAR